MLDELETGKQITLFNEWNPRYSAYAKAHGKTEYEMIVHDEATYPGGCMGGFIVWINEKWREWKTLNKIPSNLPLYNEHHEAFDTWLLIYPSSGAA